MLHWKPLDFAGHEPHFQTILEVTVSDQARRIYDAAFDFIFKMLNNGVDFSGAIPNLGIHPLSTNQWIPLIRNII